ncbi:MAG: ATP-binding cassette domain-containing protein [Bacteroidales bacterium]
MNLSLLETLTQLFALLAVRAHIASRVAQLAFAHFLEGKDLSSEQVLSFTKLFDKHFIQLNQGDDTLKEHSPTSKRTLRSSLSYIANSVNQEFEQHQKIWLILQLIEFIGDLQIAEPNILQMTYEFATMLRISELEYNNGMNFILGDETSMPINDNILLVASTNIHGSALIHFLENEKMQGKVYVLMIESTSTLLVKYFGNGNLFLNGRNLNVGRAYIFGIGSVIRSPKIAPIYYNKVIGTFQKKTEEQEITFVAQDISYRFGGSHSGVYPFSFHACSGELIAIMGGSGVGKSTLLNLLNGYLKPRTGKITINGHDIHSEIEMVKGVIGYVPQDDMLIEELTVYENLYYNALLCFRDYSEQQIAYEIDSAIEQFDLVEARDLKVGNPLNKFISGGQRKRLNMAIELIRKPSVLFVDEPTSGLSSIDSEKVMLHLKRQSMRGKLVVVNIHQPSSDLFKLFNRIVVMDQGGHVIYQGNPMDAMGYFKEAAHFLNPEESECVTCGNVSPDLILRVVETRVVNEYGKLTRKRKRSAEDWYKQYMLKINPKIWSATPPKSELPKNDFKIPRRITQLLIFMRRTISAKLANRQYMLIAMFEAPILAFILGYFTKFISGTSTDANAYVFSENSNIPSYLFMSVVAVIFFGLSTSAQEIIKDRKILHRERFLNLNRNSYLLSKVFVLMMISAIQALSFTLVGNSVLEIQGLTMEYFVVLFSASVCANLIGLNISSALYSELAIYILIPLILVPQLLFSGVVVRFEKLYKTLATSDYTPIVADAMISRWAYEALAVAQFKHNAYEKELFECDMKMSKLSYLTGFYLPQIEANIIMLDRELKQQTPEVFQRIQLLRNEAPKLQEVAQPFNLQILIRDSLTTENYSATYAQRSLLKMDTLRKALGEQSRMLAQHHNNCLKMAEQRLGGRNALVLFKQAHYNKALTELVLNQNEFDKIRVEDNRLVQVKDPIFRTPLSHTGRGHLYAPYKLVGRWEIDTLWFNIIILWFSIVVFYVLLYFDVFSRLMQEFERKRLQRIAKRIAHIVPR